MRVVAVQPSLSQGSFGAVSIMRRALLFLLLSIAIVMPSGAEEFDRGAYTVSPGLLVERLEEGLAPLGVADDVDVRSLAPLALDLIKDFEGWFAEAYDDPVGYCTIGYGHLLSLVTCAETDLGEFSGTLTIDQGTDLLLLDLLAARIAVQDLVSADVELNDDQFGALVSFVFNVGQRNFAKSTMLELLNDGLYAEAADQFPRWVRAKKRILPGLVARRSCEESLFRGYLTYDADGKFSRSLCFSLGIAPDLTYVDIDEGEQGR